MNHDLNSFVRKTADDGEMFLNNEGLTEDVHTGVNLMLLFMRETLDNMGEYDLMSYVNEKIHPKPQKSS